MPVDDIKTDILYVNSSEDNTRIDRFLSSRYAVVARGYFQRRIKAGDVMLNGSTCRASEKVRAGDRVWIKWVIEKPAVLKAAAVPFSIIHEDTDLMVVNKPPGTVVHPNESYKQSTLVHGLLDYAEEIFRAMMDEEQRPGIVHRLDKDTSGVMVVAKNEETRELLKAEFKERRVEKTYLAIVSGMVGEARGEIEVPIGRHPVNRRKRMVMHENGKYAKTIFRTLASNAAASLLEVNIETGRTHQIRVHLSSRHYPVLGDKLYGGVERLGDKSIKRQMLHSWKLLFRHPVTGTYCEYRAPLPDDFCETLRLARLHNKIE
ncbi:MAG: RluA family pseudouridine synthase [Verrucomicrobiota bacterium]